MMNNKEFADKAIKIAKNYKTSYLLGSFGHVANKSNLNRLLNQYPENYNWADKAQEIIGQGFYFDCCGLIKGLAWGFSGDLDKVYGGAIYGSNNVADWDANTIIAHCSDVSTNFNSIIVGEAVWLNNHIGIYVGNQKVVECTPSWNCCVQITNLSDRKWLKHGKLPWVDYSTTSFTNNTGTLPPGQSVQVAFAQFFDRNLAGEYTVQTGGYGLNLRKNCGTDADIIKVFPDGTHIMNYGYYSVEKDNGVKWLLVAVEGYKGFMSSRFLVRH